MVRFSSDRDIIKYEPILFGELYLQWQVLAEGSGAVLSGTTLTASGEDFESKGVSSGGVVYLCSDDGVINGVYEIVSVDSATELTVSVLRGDDDGDTISPGSASSISYRVSTFDPQASEAGYRLTQYFGIQPGDAASSVSSDDILNTGGLRQASVFSVLSSIYAMLASQAQEENHWKKSLAYQRTFEKSLAGCRVCVDISGDGVTDVTLVGGSVRLIRE